MICPDCERDMYRFGGGHICDHCSLYISKFGELKFDSELSKTDFHEIIKQFDIAIEEAMTNFQKRITKMYQPSIMDRFRKRVTPINKLYDDEREMLK